MKITKKVAKNIRKYWKESFYKLAKKADIPYSTLGNIIFKQKNDLKVSTLLKIAKALNVSIDKLVK